MLPDADKLPQSRFSRLLACCFDFVVGRLYRIETLRPPQSRLLPGSLIISNHLRDSDVPVLTVALIRRQGLHFREPLPFLATREDLFQRDALARLSWPSPLSRLFGLIPVSWLLWAVRARPLRRLREFTFADMVAELMLAGLGSARPIDLFNARGLRELVAQTGALPSRLGDVRLEALGRLRYSIWGLRRLRLATLRQIQGQFRAHIAKQLARFAALLENGGGVFLAPEGTISRTGRFGIIRAGARQLCQCSRAPVTILPNALSYDPLRSGRLRVVVSVGEPLRDLTGSPPRQFDGALRQAILGLRVITPSHLMAWFLCTGPGQFSMDQFTRGLRQGVAIAVASGVRVDPLLERQTIEHVAAKRLRWLQRRHLLRRSGSLWTNSWPRGAEPGWHDAAAIVAFLANALADLGPAWQRGPTA